MKLKIRQFLPKVSEVLVFLAMLFLESLRMESLQDCLTLHEPQCSEFVSHPMGQHATIQTRKLEFFTMKVTTQQDKRSL